MSEDAEPDPVEDALLQMGVFDAREAAVDRAEAEGGAAKVPEFSNAKMDAIVAASLRAAALEPEVEGTASSTTQSRHWIWWACGVAVAVAAALVLWQAPPSQVESSPGTAPLPLAQLRLGGTARTLGDTPTIRSYGPGDAFFVELSIDTELQHPIVADLFARDPAGATRRVALSLRNRDGLMVFEGEIAELLAPGIWTLQVRYGRSHSCSGSTPDGCKTLETRIKVVGP